ncbi:hypothetical protein [Methylophaga thiooxydans]|uniref:hypothetical protein n=1 Tax=Methylophaga thiooxydans TaxID=392484 RepID=UPI002354F081|nr:hypothetical protein [Methylophaga thiooxydans]
MKISASLFLLLTSMFWQPAFAEESTAIKILQQDRGRDYGLMVGELIHHHYIISTDSDYTLTTASLPIEGELNYWLDLHSVELKSTEKQNRTIYRLSLVYQSFYAPLDVRVLTIPAITLDFITSQEQRVSLTLDEWAFTMSPIKEITPSGVGNGDGVDHFMKPSIQPHRLKLKPIETRLIILSSLLLLCLLFYVALSGWLPRLNRSPFLQAKRQIKALSKQDLKQTEHYQACLQALHQAINQRAGQTIFFSRLDTFLNTHPAFQTLDKPLRNFFTLSEASFFFAAPPEPSYIKDCIRLCHQLADADKVSLKS